MADEKERRIFARNLNHYISLSGKQQKEIAQAIGENTTTFNMWCTGKVMPGMGKIQKVADYFGIGKSFLTDEQKPDVSERFAEIASYIGIHDERFQQIIIDYFNMPADRKNKFCDFYEEFIKK